MDEDVISQEPVFVCGNERLARLLSDPEVAADVAEANIWAGKLDRVHTHPELPFTQP
jgi:hypothetical protein